MSVMPDRRENLDKLPLSYGTHPLLTNERIGGDVASMFLAALSDADAESEMRAVVEVSPIGILVFDSAHVMCCDGSTGVRS